MSAMPRRPLWVLISVLVITMATVLLGESALLAATKPLPGERFLSDADKSLALRGMTPREYEALAPVFANNRILIVAYARREYSVTKRDDGTLSFESLGMLDPHPGPLDIPSFETAALVSQVRPNSNLYMSLYVYRTCSTCLQWNIQFYYDWQGTLGLGSNNGNEDRIATAWGNNLAIKTGSYYMTGYYTNGLAIPTNSQYLNANAGVGFGFREFYKSNLGAYANWGRGYAAMTEASYHGVYTNVIYKYQHTVFAAGGTVTIGPASISFSGGDWEWGLSVTVTT